MRMKTEIKKPSKKDTLSCIGLDEPSSRKRNQINKPRENRNIVHTEDEYEDEDEYVDGDEVEDEDDHNKNYQLNKPFGFIYSIHPLPPVIVEVPSELPKVSLVNASLKKLKFHLTQFDSAAKKRTTPNALEEEIVDLKAHIQDKVFVITSLKNDLQKLKGKEIVENIVHIPSANTIAAGMFKLDLEPLPPRLLQNREVHINYLRNTQEQANILWEIVEQAKVKQPLDSKLDLACNAKKVTVKPMNNVKKVRFAEPVTSSSNIKQVESSNTSDSNTPVLSSIGVKCSTSNYGSKPPGNKKNDRISQTPSRNKKNKVEAQPRKVNKVNRVVKPVCDVDVKHSLSKANSEILCATCNKLMFDGVHDKCLLDLVQNGNKCTKSAKKHKRQNIWKPTGHIFTKVGFKWKPTGRIFTIVGNSCPLTSAGYGTVDYHLNFGTLNKLAKDGLARGIPRLKFQKDHLCSACALGKSKKSSHQPKAEEKLYLLHMDLCGPMLGRVLNWEKEYLLVISRGRYSRLYLLGSDF
ncbi:hypothetical protein Tco_1185908 [Tanacetum coccineum]